MSELFDTKIVLPRAAWEDRRSRLGLMEIFSGRAHREGMVSANEMDVPSAALYDVDLKDESVVITLDKPVSETQSWRIQGVIEGIAQPA